MFTPAEFTAEVCARDSTLGESTILTHIVSVMCVDAPANHRTRYADLERVSRGHYRRLQS